jgi:hypothetical protein
MIDQIQDLWKGVTLGGVGRGGRSGGSGGGAGRTINGVDWGVGGEFSSFCLPSAISDGPSSGEDVHQRLNG